MVVDDDRVLRELLADFLTTRGYQVLAAQDGQAALSMFDEKPPQLVILDIHLPGGMNGVKVLRELRARGYAGAVIALSGVYEDSLLKEMLSLGAVELIAKPFDLAQLGLAIQVGLVLSGCGAPSR
jgi:DNA-binding response OmpR family regulator